MVSSFRPSKHATLARVLRGNWRPSHARGSPWVLIAPPTTHAFALLPPRPESTLIHQPVTLTPEPPRPRSRWGRLKPRPMQVFERDSQHKHHHLPPPLATIVTYSHHSYGQPPPQQPSAIRPRLMTPPCRSQPRAPTSGLRTEKSRPTVLPTSIILMPALSHPQKYTHTSTHTHTHTCSHIRVTHTHTHTHRRAYTHMHTHPHACIHTRARARTLHALH